MGSSCSKHPQPQHALSRGLPPSELPCAATPPSAEPPCAAAAPSTEPPCAATAPSAEPPCAATAPSAEPACAATAPSAEPACAAAAPSAELPCAATAPSAELPCAATAPSTTPPAPPPPPRDGAVIASLSNAYLAHYTLSALGNQDVFGPFVVLRSYDPASGAYRLSVLVVCSAAAEERLGGNAPALTWWHGSAAAGGKAAAVGGKAAAAQHSVKGELLDRWRDWHFWRFGVETTVGDKPGQLSYKFPLGPARSFTVSLPARSAAWAWAFYSCNGLDKPANAVKTGGLQVMWGDVLKRHAVRPLHALVGGGDQLYNDAVFSGPAMKGWDASLDAAETAAKAALPYSDAMRDEVEEFYFAHYAAHFAQPGYSDALASIPSLNTWDDHDIVDGWGSYDPLIQQAAVMRGVFAAAQRFYLLFQHHTTPARLAADGYWQGTSQLACLGPGTAVVLADTRSSRTQQRVMQPEFYKELEARLRALPASVRQVVLVLGVPVIYPKLRVETILQGVNVGLTKTELLSAAMQKTGVMSRLPLRFGQVEVLDDLQDHWTADSHAAERDAMLKLLMSLSRERGLRFSFLSGDVHCAGYGMFHARGDTPPATATEAELAASPPPAAAALAADPCFIPQVISSAITNVPPPAFVLMKLRSEAAKAKAILGDCVQRMLKPPGAADLLIGSRNWCEVSGGGASDKDGELVFSLRCEEKMGTGRCKAYDIRVPRLARP